VTGLRIYLTQDLRETRVGPAWSQTSRLVSDQRVAPSRNQPAGRSRLCFLSDVGMSVSRGRLVRLRGHQLDGLAGVAGHKDSGVDSVLRTVREW